MATQTVTSTTQLPEALDQYGRYVLGEATNIYQNTPYTPYPYARVAGLTPDQQAAMALTRSNVGQWQPYMDQAAGMAGGIGSLVQALAARGNPSYQQIQSPVVGSQVVGAKQFPGSDISQYMNPYEAIVTQQGIRALEDAATRQQANADARFARAGAFGGSRQGLYDATLGSNTARAAGELANTSRAQNYTNAQQMWALDANRLLQADSLTAQLAAQVGLGNAQNIVRALMANQSADLQSQQMGISALGQAMQGQLGAGNLLASIGGNVAQQGRADAASLAGIGDLQRSIDQKNLDTAYGDFVEQRDYPWTQLNRLQSMGANNPLNRATTQTQTSPGPNTWSQLLGTALGVGGIAANSGLLKDVFGSGGGGGTPGAASYLGPDQGWGIINVGGSADSSFTTPVFDGFAMPDYMDYGAWGYGV